MQNGLASPLVSMNYNPEKALFSRMSLISKIWIIVQTA